MNRPRPLTFVSVGLACIGLILPGAVLEGAVPTRGASPGIPWAGDVELGPEGSLRGVVVNAEGIPIAGAAVVVRLAGREVASSRTDALGLFAVVGLRGGTYQVQIGRHAKLFRAWVPSTAPPKTRRMALVVVDDHVVRGQVPLGEFLTSDAVLITGLVGAMIAIPIAVHQSHRRVPSSP